MDLPAKRKKGTIPILHTHENASCFPCKHGCLPWGPLNAMAVVFPYKMCTSYGAHLMHNNQETNSGGRQFGLGVFKYKFSPTILAVDFWPSICDYHEFDPLDGPNPVYLVQTLIFFFHRRRWVVSWFDIFVPCVTPSLGNMIYLFGPNRWSGFNIHISSKFF